MVSPPLFSIDDQNAAVHLIDLALAEDLGSRGDLTTLSLVDSEQMARVVIVAREAGVLSGGTIVPLLFGKVDPRVEVEMVLNDGDELTRGAIVGRLRGSLRSILVAERTALNFLLRMSGIASRTAQFVAAIQGTRAQIFDTRKTLPGWRLLDKYAVRCGGGRNHRIGLFDQILIKDNHLAGWLEGAKNREIGKAIDQCRSAFPGVRVQVEVDTLEQLHEVLTSKPEMVLLDNMTCEQMRQAVRIRDAASPQTELEASGGVNLQTVRAIAETGVDRISIGGLTHSAPALDLAFDWGSD